MRRRGEGRIVNIASIGGKISVPHLLPYSASKFALVGLSEGLRAELSKDGIVVTTVCPGLMRTGSPRLGWTNRLLPRAGGIGSRSAKGRDSQSAWSPSLLTVLNERAARRNNEL